MIQCQFLNRIIDKQDGSLLILNNITSDFFSDYVSEFNFIKDHLSKYNQVPDKETFLAKFPDFDLIKVSEPDSYLIDELYKDKNKRALAKTFNKVRDLLNNDETDAAMSLYVSAAQDISEAVHLDSIDILSDTSRYQAYVEKCNDFSKYYIPTGFIELDKIIGGWDRQEELATISARPNVGKSYILFKSALAAAQQGLTVGIYSGEMSENKVGYRIDTFLSHISNTKIIHGNIEIQNEYKQYLDNLKNTVKGKLKVLTPAMISGPAGVSALRAFIEKDKLDILFIDQHSLLEDDRRAKNPVERASNISRDLKNLQVLKHIPIIAVSQQNRTSTENGIGTEHIAQTDRISQDSTILIFLEQKDGILTLNLVKSRDSSNGQKIKYIVDFDKGIFTYMPNEADALKGADCEKLKAEFEEDVVEGEAPF